MGPVIVVMGASASGKSAVGALLARRLDVPFKEGDDLHPAGNVAKMKAGRPLDGVTTVVTTAVTIIATAASSAARR